MPQAGAPAYQEVDGPGHPDRGERDERRRAQSAWTAPPHSGQRKGRRLAMDRQTTKTTKGNPIFGISRVAWTVPCVAHCPVWVWTSLGMVYLPVIAVGGWPG